MNKLKVMFEMEKDTKNTIRFKEVVAGPLDTPKVGTIYVPKASLKVLILKIARDCSKSSSLMYCMFCKVAESCSGELSLREK